MGKCTRSTHSRTCRCCGCCAMPSTYRNQIWLRNGAVWRMHRACGRTTRALVHHAGVHRCEQEDHDHRVPRKLKRPFSGNRTIWPDRCAVNRAGRRPNGCIDGEIRSVSGTKRAEVQRNFCGSDECQPSAILGAASEPNETRSGVLVIRPSETAAMPAPGIAAERARASSGG